MKKGFFMDKAKSEKLAKKIVMAIVLGILVGFFVNFIGAQWITDYTNVVGQTFIRLLRMVIVPLVLSSIYLSMVNLGDPADLGEIGGRTILYYLCTTFVGVAIAILCVTTFKPGVGTTLLSDTEVSSSSTMSESKSSLPFTKEQIESAEKIDTSAFGIVKNIVKTLFDLVIGSIPKNPIKAMADGKMLQIIVFAILMGLVGLFYRDEASGVTTFMTSLEAITLKMVYGIMHIAPYGIFALMLNVIANSGFDAIRDLGGYFLIVLLALFLHMCSLLGFAIISSRKAPWTILKGLSSAIFTAFSTSSSAASLPVTMKCVTENLGVRDKTATFVLPLGTTVNMDGTGIYLAISTIFIAQVYGFDLSMSQYLTIWLTSSMAAVGTSAIPGGSLVTMGIVVSSVGLPLSGIKLIVALNGPLDMFRTVVNVVGDAVGSIAIDSKLKRKEAKESK